MTPDAQNAYNRAIAVLNALPGPVSIVPFLTYMRTLSRTPTADAIDEALAMFLRKHAEQSP